MARCACREGNPCAYHEALGECWPEGEPTICERIGIVDDLKLFVWEEVLTDYTDGVMFALAPDVETARKMILKKCDYVGEDLEKEPAVHTKPFAFVLWGGG